MDSIVSGLQDIINSEVSKRISNESDYKDKYEDLVNEIKSMIYNGEDLYKDMKENEFSYGSIEAEGYLRFGRTLLNLIEDYYGE